MNFVLNKFEINNIDSIKKLKFFNTYVFWNSSVSSSIYRSISSSVSSPVNSSTSNVVPISVSSLVLVLLQFY